MVWKKLSSQEKESRREKLRGIAALRVSLVRDCFLGFQNKSKESSSVGLFLDVHDISS